MKLTNKIHINSELEPYSKYAHDPRNWVEFNEGLDEVDRISGSGEVGTHIDGNYHMLGMKMPLSIDVLECSDSKWVGELHGSLEVVQTYNVEVVEDGLDITVITEGPPAKRILDKVKDNAIYRNMMSKSVEHSLEKLKDIVEHLE